MASRIARRFASTANSSPVYGFIGLGQMGRHMANNLAQKSNAKLIVHDVNSAAAADFAKRHPQVESVASPRAVAEKANIIVTMLPSSPHVEKVYLDRQSGIISGIRPGTTLLDSSTIDPMTSQRVTTVMKASIDRTVMVDAPVSGGVLGAEAGTLTFMVGSDSESEFNQVKPVLAMMGKNIVHCGKQGMGQVAKICNNMLLGISMVATAETMNLGIRCGMDPKVLSGIIATSSGRNWSLDTYNPVPNILPNVPSSKGYKGGFGIELMLKDMGLACQSAAQTGSTVMLGAMANEVYRVVSGATVVDKQGAAQPLKGHDFSVVFKWLSDTNAKKQ